MIKKIKSLYKSMKDDLEDSEMAVKYAMTFVHLNDKDEAMYYLNEANKRIDNFIKKHSRFIELIDKLEIEANEVCDMYYKCFMEWYEHVQCDISSTQKIISSL